LLGSTEFVCKDKILSTVLYLLKDRGVVDMTDKYEAGNSSNSNDPEGKVNSPEAEVLDDEPRNLLLALLGELRLGMDLARVTLPTFVLEPRSFLEKLTDFMAHSELLALVPKINDPVGRILGVVKWYLSGFYIKPQGVKKPYNPILGEFYRCKWKHPESSTFYVAEQVSHHPPVSCLFVSNRKDGFLINCSIHPRSKFLGTSAASILEGTAYLTILPFDEEYSITFPSAYVRGILFGTLLMEMCGVVCIQCLKTKCKAEIEFKAKPFWGGDYNGISAKIKRNKDTLYTISGKWDGRMDVTNSKTKQTEVLWDPKTAQLNPKIVPPLDKQEEFESQRLWSHVSAALRKKDQREATTEKTKLEDAQRQTLKVRKDNNEEWIPRLFRQDRTGRWIYKYMNTSPRNPDGVGEEEEEEDGIIYTKSVGKQTTVQRAGSNLRSSLEYVQRNQN